MIFKQFSALKNNWYSTNLLDHENNWYSRNLSDHEEKNYRKSQSQMKNESSIGHITITEFKWDLCIGT